MIRGALLWTAILLTACRGELNPADETDATTAANTGSGTGGGAENLLSNPSFEEWAGGNPFAWTLETDGWMQTMENALDGASAVRVTGSSYGGIAQTIVPAQEMPAGTQLAAEISSRHVDGDTTSVFLGIYLTMTDGTDLTESQPLPSFSGSQWVTGSVAIEATAPIETITLDLSTAQGEAIQTVDFDAASLWVVE